MDVNKFLWCCLAALPLRHLQLNSPYGYRVHPITGHYTFHSGVDFRAHADSVYAVLDGVVNGAGHDRILGIYIRLYHGDFQSSYGHLSQVFVGTGDTVAAGDVIALTGSTGRVTGEHLHFSVAFHYHSIDPLKFMQDIQKLNQNNKETKP